MRMLSVPRLFGGGVLLGLIAAIALTFILRMGSRGAEVGFLFVCTIDAVPAPDFPGVLTTIVIEPLPLFVLLVPWVGYLLLFGHLRRVGRTNVATWPRLAVFSLGMGLAVLTVFGPLAAYSRMFLSVHMVQHFILIAIAPPLILLGNPLTLLLAATPGPRRRQLLAVTLHAGWFRAVTNPFVGIALFAIVPLGLYITPAFELSLTNEFVHFGGYGLFLLAGIHYWWPVAGRNPSAWFVPHGLRVVYLLVMIPLHAALGYLFYQPTRVIYEEFALIERSWGPSALTDQQFAGAMMVVVGEMLGLITMLLVAIQWSQVDDRQAKRDDRARAKAAELQRG